MCRRASVCPRVRGARAYRDTPGDEFGVFTDVLSRARAPGDDRSGNTPIFAIPIFAKRVLPIGSPGSLSVLSRATDVPCPSLPLVTTAPRSSAPPPSPLSSRRLRRPARLPSAASPRSLSLPGYVIRSNHSRDWCNRIHVSLGAHGVRTRRIGTGRPRSDPHASPRAARSPRTRRTRRFGACSVPEPPAFFWS